MAKLIRSARIPGAPPVAPAARIVAAGIGAVAVAALFWSPSPAPVPYVAAEAFPVAIAEGTPLVIDLVDGATPEQVATVSAALGAPLMLAGPETADAGLYVAELPAGETDAEAISVLQSIGGGLVEAAEPEQSYAATEVPAGPTAWLGFPDDPGLSAQWNLAAIGASTGWRAGGGRGVVVAVIDTGVTPSAELKNVLPGATFVPGGTSSADDNGHGTHVAGTIAQATDNGIGVAGVAPNATILPLKVLSASGSGQTAWIAAAIDYAVDHGAQVINMSLGGGHSDVLVNAVERARGRGVIVVAAAGNSGGEGIGSPADAEHALAVSAFGPTGALAPYSSWGKGVEIAGPGGDKTVTGGGITQAVVTDGKVNLTEFQGTSMASPHVAGAAAVLLGMGATPTEAECLLLDHAAPGPGAADDAVKFGAGKLDVSAAVRTLLFARQGLLFAVGSAIAFAVSLLAGLRGWARLGTVLSAGVAAGGLFVLPLLPLPPTMLGDLVQRPFQEWPTASFFGVAVAGFPLWQSAIVPALAVIFVSPSRYLGPLAVGLALGVGTYLLYGAATSDIPLWLPMIWGRTWLTVNGTVALVAALAGSGMLRLRQPGAAS